METLKTILKYRPNDVIDRFTDDFDVTSVEAEEIFVELLKFLWLCAKSKKEGDTEVFIDTSTLIIDEMWHTFLLFTREYQNFCENKLGVFIHHIPLTSKNKKNIDYDRFVEKTEKLYKFIHRYLGEKTLIKWFETYSNKYTIKYIKSIRKL